MTYININQNIRTTKIIYKSIIPIYFKKIYFSLDSTHLNKEH